jgi:hypothetical protein
MSSIIQMIKSTKSIKCLVITFRFSFLVPRSTGCEVGEANDYMAADKSQLFVVTLGRRFGGGNKIEKFISCRLGAPD